MSKDRHAAGHSVARLPMRVLRQWFCRSIDLCLHLRIDENRDTRANILQNSPYGKLIATVLVFFRVTDLIIHIVHQDKEAPDPHSHAKLPTFNQQAMLCKPQPWP
jgi:hypothetical protein